MWTNGSRRGAPVILVVDAAAMAERGHLFYRSEHVPAWAIAFPG